MFMVIFRVSIEGTFDKIDIRRLHARGGVEIASYYCTRKPVNQS